MTKKQKIKVKWSKAKTRNMYMNGFKYCVDCVFMIKIDEIRCRKCNTVFRTRPRSASNLFNLVTESIYEPITIYSLRRKD